MRLIFNGIEGNAVGYIRGADATFNVQVLDDTGAGLTLVSPANAVLELFTAQARSDTPPITLNVTGGAGAAAGFGTVSIEDTAVTLARGTTYYVWAKWRSGAGTGAGTTVLISNAPATISVR